MPIFDIYTQHFITGIVKERFDMCQVGNICLKSPLMDERGGKRKENHSVWERERVEYFWFQFAYLELRKTRSVFSIPLDFEIAKVACILPRGGGR